MGHLGGDRGHGFRGCRDDGLARQCADVLCPTDCDVSTGLRCMSRRANCPGLSDVGACRHWLEFGVGARGLCRSYTTGLRELSQPALTRNAETRKTRPFLGRVFFWVRLLRRTFLFLSGHSVGKGALLPKHLQRADQTINIFVAVQRSGCEAQPLGALWHSGVVDRLHVNAEVLHQDV